MSDPIRVVRNEQGNCVNFVGTTNPAYWNACLSAVVDDEDPTRISIINDIRTKDGSDPVYEFYKLPFSEFADADGNVFATAQETADYITSSCRVVGVSADSVGSDLTGESVCFSLDATSTSILFDIGYSYGVNTIKAIPHEDGTIHITSILGNRTLFSGLEPGLACKADGSVIPGGLNDVTNYLNELFTVGAFEAVVISDPYATMVADVDGVTDGGSAVGSNAIDPTGTDILASSSSHYNRAGWVSAESIDQAGEYFTFDIRVTDSMGFGLILDQGADKYGAGSYADPAMFCNDSTSNSANWGYYWSHWFHSGNKGPWTYYGQRTSSSIREGWAGFAGSDERAAYLADAPIKMKVGIDANGYMEVAWYDVSESSWRQVQRSSYVIEEGESLKLGIKIYGTRGRLHTVPKKHLLQPAAPTMYFRYIESPDGQYDFPLFATEAEANYWNTVKGGPGTSHTHTYPDDPTNTTWYMPDTYHEMGSSTNPSTANTSATTFFDGNPIVWTEITSLTDGDLVPRPFTYNDISQQEGSAINIQTQPQDTGYTTTITGLPPGLTAFAGIIQGTLPEVASDTTYTVTVTRTNSYGSSQGTFDITVTNVAPVQTNDTPWTKALDFSGAAERAVQVSTHSMYNPLMMGGLSSQVIANPDGTKTAYSGFSRPWATACVFKYDGHNSNQHIWNAGEGVNGDNIYLRMAANGYLYFGWGRDGVKVNECSLGGSLDTNKWFGVYVAHNGTRLSGNNATGANLADAFDIYLMRLNDAGTQWVIKTGTLTTGDGNRSTANNWNAGSTGYRMDRATTGQMSIGGRGANRSFQGKIASMVVTTLEQDTTMPTTAEVEKMITDPVSWLNTYKVGNPYRHPTASVSYSNFQINGLSENAATQVWLMGDGASDSYSNMIRNRVRQTDQNYTKLNMISMVSNDIQNVNIPGLT